MGATSARPPSSRRRTDRRLWRVKRSRESVAPIAHGGDVADIVLSGELDRQREMIEVLPGTELVRQSLADARARGVFSAEQVAADLAARRDRAV